MQAERLTGKAHHGRAAAVHPGAADTVSLERVSSNCRVAAPACRPVIREELVMPDLNYINKKNGERKKRPRARGRLARGEHGLRGRKSAGKGR
jgi:hypothetical protein